MNTQTISEILKDWSLWPNICSFQPSLEHVKPLVDGLTNSNWLLEINNNQYVIRINATNDLALKLNRQSEWDMHQSISSYGICPAYLYRDPSDTYWIRPFLKTHTLESTIAQNKSFFTSSFLKVIAIHFKAVHSTPIAKGWPRIIYSELIEHYWQQISKKQNNTKNKPEQSLKNRLANIKKTLRLKLEGSNYTECLCHMDPNPSNWILDKKELHLIDWEYAALGNKAWDLAVFSDTCFLSTNQMDLLLKHYQDINRQQLDLARVQMKYLSALWYYVQGHLTDTALLKQLNDLLENISNP